MARKAKTEKVTDWLLLRGLGREARHWGAFVAQLEKSSKARVHTLDLAGAGTEFDRPAYITIPEYTLDVRRRWLPLGDENPDEPRTWGLLTMSLGGMIGIEWTHRFPADFKRHVVINSSAANISLPFDRLRPKNYTRVLKVIAESELMARELMILDLTSTMRKGDEKLAETWASFSEQYPVGRKNLMKQLLAAMKFHAPKSPEVPTLIMASAEDQFVDPRCSLSLARHLEMPLVVHPKAGHDIPLDDPAWVCDQVKRHG